jgi:hypothetical protein
MATATIDREVTRRIRNKQREESQAQRAQIRAQVETEQVAQKNAAERAARVAKGNKAAAIVKSQAPFIALVMGGVKVAVVLGAGDQVVSATAIESVKQIATVVTKLQRDRVARALATGEVPALDEQKIRVALHAASRASQHLGTAALGTETDETED